MNVDLYEAYKTGPFPPPLLHTPLSNFPHQHLLVMLDPNLFLNGARSPMSPSSPRSPGFSSPSRSDSSASSPPSPQTPQLQEQLLMQLQLLAFAEHGIGSELEEL